MSGFFLFLSYFHASVRMCMHVEVQRARDLSSVGTFRHETAAQSIPSKVLKVWPGKRPTSVGDKQLSWNQELAANDIRSTEWVIWSVMKEEKKRQTKGRVLWVEKWNSFVAHCMKGINILRALIILPQSCRFELKRKAWRLLWHNSFHNPISLGVISVGK